MNRGQQALLFVFLGLLVGGISSRKLMAAQSPSLENQSELGVVIAGGNSKVTTINVKHETEYKWVKNIVRFQGALLYGRADDQINTRNWNFELRYERELSEIFSLFAGFEYEADTFAGFDNRSNIDMGGKYFFIKDADKQYLFTETGYRFSKENRIEGSSPDSITSHIARIYFEWGKQFFESTKTKLWIEYLPDFSNSGNYRFNFEPSLQVSMSKILSLKMAYLGKYRNEPSTADNLKFDYTYTTALVADF